MPGWRVRAVVLPAGDRVEDLWIADGRLTRRPQATADELPGRFVLPGLVDAHAHLAIDLAGTGLPPGDPSLLPRNLSAQVAAGVLLIRDVGAPPGSWTGGDHEGGPAVEASGRFLAPEGRYLPHLYEPTPPSELVAAVAAEIARGARWVKIIADFPKSIPPPPDDLSQPPTYDPDVLAAAVAAAHAAGARVAAHAGGDGLDAAVAAGVDSVEHGPGITAAHLDALGARGGAWTPTLTTMRVMLPPMAVAMLEERMRAMLPRAIEAGVTVLAGTDACPHGSLQSEIAQLFALGLTPVEALAAASTAARAYLGYPGLEDGAPADLVTYSADPRDDPEVLAHPTAIVRGGQRLR